MPYVVYSESNLTSKNIGESLLEVGEFEELESVGDARHFKRKGINMIGIKESMLEADYLDDLVKTDLFVFVCSHKSAKEIASLTVHPEGNWSDAADLGGKPRQLSFASPEWMLCFLRKMDELNDTGFPVVYEATHHGPLLKTPSLFVEVGGNRAALESKKHSMLLARVTLSALEDGDPTNFSEPVLGVGGLHYAEKFTRLAFDRRYAFGHMMSKHHVSEIGMLEQAVERSSKRPDKAIIEWKSIKSAERERIIAALDALGMDHERT